MRDLVTAATNALFDEYLELAADLSGEDWAVRSLCPEWSVREVIAHAVGVEDVLTGWAPSTTDIPPIEKMTDFVDASSEMSESDFVDRVEQILSARRQELSSFDDRDLELASLTPVGVHTYGRFLSIRVFDLWVHLRDVSRPLGRATYDGGAGAEIALDEVARCLGLIVGNKVGLPEGMSVRFELTGALQRRLGAVVTDGRARPLDADELDRHDEPSVVVRADATSFVMLACGRIDPQGEIDAGRVTWSGDDEWGEATVRRLRFTI